MKLTVTGTPAEIEMLDAFLFREVKKYKLKATVDRTGEATTAKMHRSPEVLFLSEKSHTSNRWRPK